MHAITSVTSMLRLSGLLSRPLKMYDTSMATLICAQYGTTILTNYEPSELVAERIFCAFQVRTLTINYTYTCIQEKWPSEKYLKVH